MAVYRTYVSLLSGFLGAVCSISTGSAQSFYEGKTVRVVHGFATGGGFDTVARLVTQHLGEHLAGAPDFVVESMPGAGSLIAVNYLANKAEPDGLTMGFVFANVLVDEGMGLPGVQFDSSKFEWLGAPSAGTPVCTFMTRSGIKNMEDWKSAETPPKLGAIARGAEMAYSMPKLLETQADLPMQIIVGHKDGNPALKLAAERGEIDGFCASLEATTILLGDSLKSGDAHVVVQFGEEANQAIADVPLAKEFINTPDGVDLIRVAVAGPQRLNRAFAFPPGTPAEQVEEMREALMKTFEDPDFLAAAKKSNVNVDPVSGEEVEEVIAQMHAVSEDTLAKLKSILSDQ
jgi:tripartite-type tricarboxylate transporter receptor subunit TctC